MKHSTRGQVKHKNSTGQVQVGGNSEPEFKGIEYIGLKIILY